MLGMISLLVAMYLIVGIGLAVLAWREGAAVSEVVGLIVAWPVVALRAGHG